MDGNNNFFGYSPYNNLDGIESHHTDFNPVSQYEQGYMYYKFLTQQIEYKIKCKELERISSINRENKNERRIG